MNNRVNDLSIENARLIFKNFSGEAGRFNREGERSFAVRFEDPQLAYSLAADGWNIKHRDGREDGDEGYHYMTVAVAFGQYPPKVILINGLSGRQTLMTEETIGSLDYCDIENVDVVIRPYTWEVNGNHGIKAYLKAMYVTLKKPDFGGKYEQEPVMPDPSI